MCMKWTEVGRVGAEFKMKIKRKAKMIGIDIRMFINRNFGFFKMEGGFM